MTNEKIAEALAKYPKELWEARAKYEIGLKYYNTEDNRIWYIKDIYKTYNSKGKLVHTKYWVETTWDGEGNSIYAMAEDVYEEQINGFRFVSGNTEEY